MKVKCDCQQKDCQNPEYELEFWVEIDADCMPTGNICSAYYGDADKPKLESNWLKKTKWIKMKESI